MGHTMNHPENYPLNGDTLWIINRVSLSMGHPMDHPYRVTFCLRPHHVSLAIWCCQWNDPILFVSVAEWLERLPPKLKILRNNLCPQNLLKTNSVLSVGNGSPTLFTTGEGEGGEEQKWHYTLLFPIQAGSVTATSPHGHQLGDNLHLIYLINLHRFLCHVRDRANRKSTDWGGSRWCDNESC